MAEKQRRSAMKPVSETARAWGEALRAELEQWPGVRVQRSFGMIFAYRGEIVFAALPGTRALFAEDAIMVKFYRESASLAARIEADQRFLGVQPGSGREGSEGRKWRVFALREDRDVHGAVEWLAEAYGLAQSVRRSKRPSGKPNRKAGQ